MQLTAYNTLWLALGIALLTLSVGPQQNPVKVNPRDDLAYVWIAPGSYFTGCSPEDAECMGRELPRQKVTLAKGFWIGRTEVTQAAYEHIMGSNPSRYRGANRPVEQVDWQSARTYCSIVGMRLPIESEWEYAASGGTSDSEPRYGPLDAIAWYDGNSEDRTHDVALKKPNAYGLFDMLGNVWEWVEDTPPIDPHRRIMKGGSFYNISRDIRMPNREFPVVELRHRNVGFRCAGN
ncbi:MAG: formylglycine-generating enzyme family protein [Granulicella sp.]